MTAATARIKECRVLPASHVRADKVSGKRAISGYCATYSTMSSDLGGWTERIMPGTFTRALKEKQDVRALINHDPNKVIGRTASGTLELFDDSKGLGFRCDLPDTSFARDLEQSIERGDMGQCSFGFITRADRWVVGPDKSNIRELLDVDLFDISIVAFPAYPGTSASEAARSMFPGASTLEIRSFLGEIKRRVGVASAARRDDFAARVDRLQESIELDDAKRTVERLFSK